MTAHGGRGLSIITSLARDWGVEDRGDEGGVTVWAVVAPPQHSISASARLTGLGLTGMRGMSSSRTRRARRPAAGRPPHRSGASSATSLSRATEQPGHVDGGVGPRKGWHGERRGVTRDRELLASAETLESPEALEERRELEKLTGLTDFTHLDELDSLSELDGLDSRDELDSLDSSRSKRH